MTFLNCIFRLHCIKALAPVLHSEAQIRTGPLHSQIDEILDYINQNLAENLSISMLAAHFYLSNSYLCKIFKTATGTTINRYITAKRISQAKAMLAEGYSVAETGSLCGFGDYSNFLKSFTKVVGISPKKYASFTQ